MKKAIKLLLLPAAIWLLLFDWLITPDSYSFGDVLREYLSGGEL